MWLPDRGERDLEKEGLNNREVVKRTHDHKHNPYHIYNIYLNGLTAPPIHI